MNRAIWKGTLHIGKETVPVALHSVVQDRKAHFHLLHKQDLEPVRQRIIRKSDRKEVAEADRLKAYPLDEQTAVIIRPEELEKLAPAQGKDVTVSHFVPVGTLGDQWLDRPYYLSPQGSNGDYFALVAALEKERVTGIAQWVMREKRYLGALMVLQGYLALVSLRWADQVLDLPAFQAPQGKAPSAQEIKLGEQLVQAISGNFDATLWQDEYREKLWALIRAKAAGKVARMPKARHQRDSDGLADSLRKSLQTMKVAAHG